MNDLVLVSTDNGEFEALIMVPSDWSNNDVINHVNELTNEEFGPVSVDERKQSNMLLREFVLYERK